MYSEGQLLRVKTTGDLRIAQGKSVMDLRGRRCGSLGDRFIYYEPTILTMEDCETLLKEGKPRVKLRTTDFEEYKDLGGKWNEFTFRGIVNLECMGTVGTVRYPFSERMSVDWDEPGGSSVIEPCALVPVLEPKISDYTIPAPRVHSIEEIVWPSLKAKERTELENLKDRVMKQREEITALLAKNKALVDTSGAKNPLVLMAKADMAEAEARANRFQDQLTRVGVALHAPHGVAIVDHARRVFSEGVHAHTAKQAANAQAQGCYDALKAVGTALGCHEGESIEDRARGVKLGWDQATQGEVNAMRERNEALRHARTWEGKYADAKAKLDARNPVDGDPREKLLGKKVRHRLNPKSTGIVIGKTGADSVSVVTNAGLCPKTFSVYETEVIPPKLKKPRDWATWAIVLTALAPIAGIVGTMWVVL